MNERIDGNNEPIPEMTPRLSEADYEAKIETLAKRMLQRLADDDTDKLMDFDSIEIRAIFGETEAFHAQYPFSAIEHGKSEPSPGAWEWIEDVPPEESLRRQALDIVAGDVSERVQQMAESDTYTYRDDGITYVDTLAQSETGSDDEATEASNSSNDGTDTPAFNEHAPEWDLPTDEAGQPDYEAAVEEIGLEYDHLFTIDTEYYRYHGRRHDDLVVAPQTEYGNIVEDCLPVGFVWAAYCEGRVGHGPPLTGHGMIRGVTNATGDSHIGLKPSDMGTDMESSFARIGPKNVPERGAFFVDYRYGKDMPALSLYDATDHDGPAFQFLLPTREHPTVQLVCDRTSPDHILESLPAELRERIENANEHERADQSSDSE